MRAHEFITEGKIKGKDGKACWKNYRYNGTKNGKDSCVKEDDLDEGWKDWVAGAALGAAALGGANAAVAYQPVERGDTVFSIARQNGVTPQEIMKLNHFNKDTKLVKGQKVKVPDNAKEVPAAKKVEKKPEIKQTELKQNVSVGKIASATGSTAEATLMKIASASGLKGTELAAFLAQCAHETADFKSLKEFGGSLDFRKYDPKYNPGKAKQLGNTKAGDGARYKGRGYIQLTGRYNYKKAGEELGLPLEKHPELVEKPDVAAKVAVWFWKHRVQPKVDNFHDVESVTKPINPKMNGLEDRKENFRNYMQVAMR